MSRFAAAVVMATLRCEDCRGEYHTGETWIIIPGAASREVGDRGQPAAAWCIVCAIRHGWLHPPATSP